MIITVDHVKKDILLKKWKQEMELMMPNVESAKKGVKIVVMKIVVYLAKKDILL